MKRQYKKPAKQIKVHQRIVRHAKLLVVPHKHNAYQPHLIRGTGLAVVIASVFLVQAFYNFSSTGSVLGGESNVTTEELLKETNQERSAKGIGSLRINGKLSAAAGLKAQDMFTYNYWAHTSPQGAAPWDWLNKANYNYDYAGENLAKSFSTTQGVIKAWMDSPEHRKNILNGKYRDVGFAVTSGELEGKETMLVVALYGTPKSGAAATTAVSAPAVLAATDSPKSLIARLGVQLQSMTPAALASIIVLLFTVCIGLVAHAYRKKLPRSVLKSWRRHHGMYKAVGMASLAFVFVTLYGGGQI